MDPIVNSIDEVEDDPESALRWLIEQMRPEDWIIIKRGLLKIRQSGGHGSLRLIVKDNRITDHPKVELSL